MSEPEKCRQCGIDLEPGEHGYCTDCTFEVLRDDRDMGWF